MDSCPPSRKWQAVLFLPFGSTSKDGLSTLTMTWWAETEDGAAMKAQRVGDFIKSNLNSKRPWNKGLKEKMVEFHREGGGGDGD
jgi:hypothetical protein